MSQNNLWIDKTLYPDVEAPDELEGLSLKVDFLARLCAAWDYGSLPSPDVVAEIRKPAWRTAVDECKLLTSPAYHLLRRWHQLPKLPYLGQKLPYIQNDPNLAFV